MSELPARLADMPANEFRALLEFANDVQRWSIRGYGRRKGWRFGTFGQAAKHFNVPVERIADAVAAHYWMFCNDTDSPLAERRIDHDGE